VPIVDPAAAQAKTPAWLNDVTMYHNRGDSTFEGESSEYGDFFGLDDIFTERPEVVEGMTAIYRGWIDQGVDGFRIDTVKHVNLGFWQAFSPALLDYAALVGRPDFFMFGEVSTQAPTPGRSTAQPESCPPCWTSGSRRRRSTGCPASRAPAWSTSSPRTTGSPMPTPAPTNRRPSSATTTWPCGHAAQGRRGRRLGATGTGAPGQ
jgi:hypothetical protein